MSQTVLSVIMELKQHMTDHYFAASDLLEVLNHLPRSVFEMNSYSLIRMMRDMSAAYLANIKAGRDVGEQDVVTSKHLLRRLEALDYRFITGFPHLNEQGLR